MICLMFKHFFFYNDLYFYTWKEKALNNLFAQSVGAIEYTDCTSAEG